MERVPFPFLSFMGINSSLGSLGTQENNKVNFLYRESGKT